METRSRLTVLAEARKKTKSQIIIEALERYYNEEENQLDSYTLGLPYFGKYGSGKGDLSITYKQRIKKIIKEKHNSRPNLE